MSSPRSTAKLVVVCLALVLGCNDARKTSSSTNNPVGSTAQSKSKAVVLVHGIFGDGRSTWTAEDGNTYWPDLLGGDSQFADADIVVKSYASSGSSNSVQTIAAFLAAELASVFSSHKEVVFICHSLGGLIVKEMLLDNPQYAKVIV
jgi:triacylglycerol esterase/lipase EstA (alpha/beta hydrolase family)